VCGGGGGSALASKRHRFSLRRLQLVGRRGAATSSKAPGRLASNNEHVTIAGQEWTASSEASARSRHVRIIRASSFRRGPKGPLKN
jgi:membrane protein implicated in regulation of membrane protease activity